MKRSRYLDEQIAYALHQAETGTVADLSLDKQILGDIVRTKAWGRRASESSLGGRSTLTERACLARVGWCRSPDPLYGY